MLFTSIIFFGSTVLSFNTLTCVSMNNQKYKIRSEIIDMNSNELTFYPYSNNINKCSGSCDNINDVFIKCL